MKAFKISACMNIIVILDFRRLERWVDRVAQPNERRISGVAIIRALSIWKINFQIAKRHNLWS